jgi:hypothetical protein
MSGASVLALDLSVPAGAAEGLGHAALDVVALLLLTAGLYSRRHSGRELLMVYTCFNIGLFAALTEITGGAFPAGVGFGLFGVLSIIRLRSRAFSSAEIGYFFVALVLALVTGLPGRGLLLPTALCAGLLLAVYFADHPSLHPELHVVRVTLDRAHPDTPALREVVSRQLGADVVDLRVLEVDTVRDTTRVEARYRRADGSSVPEFASADELAEAR